MECLAKVAFPDFKKTTIGYKTFDCVFIGYAHNSAAYIFMLLSDHSICESRDAIFFEHTFPLKSSLSSHVHESSVDVPLDVTILVLVFLLLL